MPPVTAHAEEASLRAQAVPGPWATNVQPVAQPAWSTAAGSHTGVSAVPVHVAGVPTATPVHDSAPVVRSVCCSQARRRLAAGRRRRCGESRRQGGDLRWSSCCRRRQPARTQPVRDPVSLHCARQCAQGGAVASSVEDPPWLPRARSWPLWFCRLWSAQPRSQVTTSRASRRFAWPRRGMHQQARVRKLSLPTAIKACILRYSDKGAVYRWVLLDYVGHMLK